MEFCTVFIIYLLALSLQKEDFFKYCFCLYARQANVPISLIQRDQSKQDRAALEIREKFPAFQLFVFPVC